MGLGSCRVRWYSTVFGIRGGAGCDGLDEVAVSFGSIGITEWALIRTRHKGQFGDFPSDEWFRIHVKMQFL